MKTDSPSPSQNIRTIQLFLAAVDISYSEMQVIIDHPKARDELRQAIKKAIYPPGIGMLRAVIGSESDALTDSYRELVTTDWDALYDEAGLGELERKVLRRRYRKGLSVAETAKSLRLAEEDTQFVESEALHKLLEARRRILREAEATQQRAFPGHLVAHGLDQPFGGPLSKGH